MYRAIRPEGGFDLSLSILNRVQVSELLQNQDLCSGFGEKPGKISIPCWENSSAAGCLIITIGQYQQPSSCHWPVEKYYSPAEFEAYKEDGAGMGFTKVESGPLVRSSYRAAGTA